MNTFKLYLTFNLILTINYISAQICKQDDRYGNAEYFSSAQIDSLKNINYSKALNFEGKNQDLKMDFYFPKNNLDTMEMRPFILFIHGGGFYAGSRKDYSYMSRELAKRGFVTATMSYRLGFDQSDDAGLIKAIYRAQQDASKALSYVLANAKKLRINNSWIFLGGGSAGAITSLLTSYADQEEWDKLVPGIESTLGPLHSTKNDPKQTFEIRGIYNHMGNIHPSAIDIEDLIPTISFHGQLDEVVPIGKNKYGFGSIPLHDMLSEAGICNDLTIVPQGGHDIYTTRQGTDFMINRVACFFKSLICGTCVDYIASETVLASCSD